MSEKKSVPESQMVKVSRQARSHQQEVERASKKGTRRDRVALLEDPTTD